MSQGEQQHRRVRLIGKATVHQAPVSTVDMGTIMPNNEPCSFRSKGMNNLGVTDITFDGPIKEHRVRTQIRKSWRCSVTPSLHQLQPFLDIIFSSVNTPGSSGPGVLYHDASLHHPR
jgi:hypothetical protein